MRTDALARRPRSNPRPCSRPPVPARARGGTGCSPSRNGRTWRAVAACQERKTADYLTEHDLGTSPSRYALNGTKRPTGSTDSRRVRRTSRLAPSRDARRGFLRPHPLPNPLRLAARELLPSLHDDIAVERSSSMRNACRPVISAPMSVEPLPPNRSSTFSPGRDENSMARREFHGLLRQVDHALRVDLLDRPGVRARWRAEEAVGRLPSSRRSTTRGCP